MTRPRLLDLYCGQGGAGWGYHLAGFDVTGVDLARHLTTRGNLVTDRAILERYPFPMVQADALEFLAFADLSVFALIHGSPVCKRYARSTPAHLRATHPNQIPLCRELMIASGRPWVIENVPGAPLRPDLKICGCSIGLHEIERERWFETSWPSTEMRPPCHHAVNPMTVAGHGEPSGPRMRQGLIASKTDWERAMGIDWMTQDGLAQAVPPAYTEHIGRMFLAHQREAAA